jgi:ABC-type phosphate transport system substrate-binding protein
MLAFVFLSPAPAAISEARVAGNRVAVIVNIENPVNQLSLADLQQIILGEKRSWSAKTPIILMMRNQQSPERELVLKRVCRMTENEYHQYWVGKIFRAEATSEPVSLPSVGTALNFVSSVNGGISFVDSASLHDSVKVLRINGHLPGEAGYPLQ